MSTTCHIISSDDSKILYPTPYKRCLLENNILSAVELPLLVETLNETRMNLKDTTEYQDYIKGRKYEREDVQKKTFAKWINSQLIKVKAGPVRDLFQDLRDGTVLLKLLEILTGKELKKEVGRMKVHHMGNVNIVLSTLRDNKIRITNINANDIVDGNPKLTLGLVWNIIQHWQVRDVLRTAVYDIHTTNLEKALLTWCQNSTKDYEDVNIKDFTKSWKDGLAFNALIHKHRPHLFNYNELIENREKFHSNMKYSEYTLENAFSIAQEKLQIERLLDIEDVITDYPDKKSIMMYVMCYFQVLSKPPNEIATSNSESLKLATLKSDKATLTQSFADTLTEHKAIQLAQNITLIPGDEQAISGSEKPQEINELLNTTNENTQIDDINSENYQKGMASISVSSSSSTTTSSPVLENYLLDLKKVIEWLVTSEQLLSNQSEICEDVNSVKSQFQTHEDFMLDLTKHQNNVGLVLQEGSRLINSGTISTEDDAEVRKQMKLLNDMWENLRLQAVERQAKLHERLMKLQTEQLNQMDIWLTNAENRIGNINQLADSLEGLNEQKDELSILQDDLVKEQEAVDCLKQIIVVVDDNTDDQAFTDLENKLSSLSDRWSNVCKFVGNRWFTVQDLILKLQSIETDFNDLNTWIGNKSVQLNILIAKTKPLVSKSKLSAIEKFTDNEIDTESPIFEEYSKMEFNSSSSLIKILKEIELEMQAMHAKLNDMNEIGEQIGTQLNNSPNLSNSINTKMDTLESKWNSLLEKMEYLSRVCTDQQQIEINQSTKARNHHVLQPIEEHSVSVQSEVQQEAISKVITGSSQLVNTVIYETDETSESTPVENVCEHLSEDEIKQYTNIDLFVNHLNAVLDHVKRLVLVEDSNLDEQQDVVQKAHNELQSNEKVLENIHTVAQYLVENMRKEGKDTIELESTVEAITRKWQETHDYLSQLTHNTEKNSVSRKANDELATLKDVHEGYQRYINSAEILSHDAQKLNLQLETNKVKLKGMNSYEPRLNNLKQLTNQLDNKDLITEIENFALSWSETYLLINDRQNNVGLKELTNQPSDSYMDSKRVILDWLAQIENSLTADDCKVTFLPVLEDRLQTFKDIQNEIRDKRSNIDYLQQNAEEIANKSTVELNVQIKSDLKHLKSRYQNLIDSVQERCIKIERLINDLKEFDNDYMRLLNALNKIEAHSQIEHHSSSQFGLSHGKSIEAELDNLKQIKYDLDNLHPGMRKINEQSERYLYENITNKPQVDNKFQQKLKDDIILINEKFKLLSKNYTKSLAYLEEAHRKSAKVDTEIDALDHWITMKDHEIPDDEGIIINEEQFDQRIAKYKQLKSEIDRRNSEVKRIIDTGNDMLKNSSGGVSNVADLARCLININNKWGNLNMKVEAKNKHFDQLSEYVNELRQLLHEEKNWLERLEKKLNSTKIGADAEELSEELDNIETFIKSHSSQSKERINELSVLLIEKQVLIMLANSDTKEFLYRWQLLHDDASRKIQSLDMAINDVQNWEKRLLELKEWVNYMDKYLTTRIDQDIFADDVPEDFARINEEFIQNEYLLKELEEGVEKYKQHGKIEAATRLDQQLNIMKKDWNDLNHKFKKFQKPADFDQKLNKVQKLLDEIEQALYMIEVNTEDSETIHLQLEHCMKFYKTLSELKSQIEFVLKQGRSIVDKKQVDNTEELTKQLDSLKQKYNDLGSRVTNGKNELEKAFKVSKKFRKEYNVINDFMGKIDGELRKIEQKPLSKNYNDELEWIKNTKTEINKVETINLETMNSLRKTLDELIRKSGSNKISGATAKIQEIEEKVALMQKRIDDRAEFLHDEANKLEDNFHHFIESSRQVLHQIEKLHHQLIEAEQSEAREMFDSIEREVNLLLSDVGMVRDQGTDLCSKSEQYSKTVETELRNLLVNFEELNRRLNMAQENQEVVTKTETRSAKFHEESKYIRRHAKSPSESSMDSTVDVFDSELRQKYMRAVAYLRILDEAPIMENEELEEQKSERNSDGVDIDFVIQQAKQVAQLNENTNPERSRRILEKVQKLEQRWLVTKNKRDSFKSINMHKNHKMRVGNAHDQINIVEEKLIEYKTESSGDDWEVPRTYYGPSDFIYDHSQQQQKQCFQRIQQDNYDTRSMMSEHCIQPCPVVQQVEPITFIRKYVTTKTTTTGIPPPQFGPLVSEQYSQQQRQMAASCSQLQRDQYLMQPINTAQTRFRCASTQNHGFQQNQQNQQSFRSSSIPPPQRFQVNEDLNNTMTSNNGNSSRFYSSSSRTTTDHMPQPTVTSSKSSSSYAHRSTSGKNTQTLPVNYSQIQINKMGASNNDHMSSSNSCIDYSNTHFNSDWKMRHGNGIEKPIIKPVPQTIPIHQE